MVEVIIPPRIGAAIGFITSEPMPDSHRIGARLRTTAVTVISLGRSRWTAPSMVAFSRSSSLSGRPDLEPMFQGFVQIDDHHDAGFDGDSEQSDIADPDRNAEVVAESIHCSNKPPDMA